MQLNPKQAEIQNICFIDWQNLHLWISSENWKLDLEKFRIYLKAKYKVKEAYYFLWILSKENEKLYKNLTKAWFTVVFRKHILNMTSKKKWNVDVDIVFEIMKKLVEENNNFKKIILVSWDWDYCKLVNYLIEKEKFEKILFPNKKYSSLYKKINYNYWINLSWPEIKNKIIFKE